MSKKQRMILIICIIIGVVLIAAGTIYYFLSRGESGTKTNEIAYVDSVASITGLGSGNGTQNRYSGVVEAQETMDIKKSDDKTVKEIFVSVGDEVSTGDPLFEYETEETALKLEQARIDLEGLANEITGFYNQITELQKEKNKASASEQLSYTTQIQEAQLNAKRSEYNKKSKEAEIEKLEKDLANATVTSEMNGIIKSMNTNGEYDNNTGQPKPFITIMARGDYRIKGKVNEQNVWSLMEGQSVIIRSRVDADITWAGTISKIDTSNSYESDNNSYGGVYYGGMGGEAGQTSTNYAFYVTPDVSGDFMLGQHVFIELNNGQDEEKSGLWMNAMYLVLEDNDAWAWVANSKNRLEKKKITLGDYDSALDEYEILDGLTADDYIAFPGNLLHEGMTCVINDGTHTNSSMDEGMDMNMGEDGMNYDDGAMMDDGAMIDDGAMNGDGSMDMNDGSTSADFDGSSFDGSSGMDGNGALPDQDGADGALSEAGDAGDAGTEAE